MELGYIDNIVMPLQKYKILGYIKIHHFPVLAKANLHLYRLNQTPGGKTLVGWNTAWRLLKNLDFCHHETLICFLHLLRLRSICFGLELIYCCSIGRFLSPVQVEGNWGSDSHTVSELLQRSQLGSFHRAWPRKYQALPLLSSQWQAVANPSFQC